MNQHHLSEDVLQEFAADPVKARPETKEHLRHCEFCKEQVKTYQGLFTQISNMEEPSFSFDLTTEVLAHLPSVVQGKLIKQFQLLPYLVAAIIFISGGIYFFRNEILSLSKIKDEMSLYIISTCVLSVLLFLLTDMYKNYEQKMKSFELI